jgi:hypothetical protein
MRPQIPNDSADRPGHSSEVTTKPIRGESCAHPQGPGKLLHLQPHVFELRGVRESLSSRTASPTSSLLWRFSIRRMKTRMPPHRGHRDGNL